MPTANILRIISDLEDLGIRYPKNSIRDIAIFYAKHIHLQLSANQLMYIIHGLGTLHTLALKNTSTARVARELLTLIYVQKPLCAEEMILIADSLFEFRCTKKLSRENIAILRKSAASSLWINNFFFYLQALIYPSITYGYSSARPIISKSLKEIYSIINCPNYHFAYYEIMGRRRSQEDTVVWSPLDERVFENLSKEQIGFRMWTAYRNLHDSLPLTNSGTTASTTICTKDYLITATLSDTIAFAIIYHNNGEVFVHRLNKRIRHADDQDEKQRIEKAGNFVADNRVQGKLSPPRNIGDKRYKGVCADADIDIFDLSSYKDVAKIQVITTCDGFTEPLVYEEKKPDTKENCEEFLCCYLYIISLHAGKQLIEMSEHEICELLVNVSLNNGSEDNISICAQTVRQGPFYFVGMLGIYDGHGGYAASHYVADNIVDEIKHLLKLSPEEYELENNSAFKNIKTYNRDNLQTAITTIGLTPGIYHP